MNETEYEKLLNSKKSATDTKILVIVSIILLSIILLFIPSILILLCGIIFIILNVYPIIDTYLTKSPNEVHLYSEKLVLLFSLNKVKTINWFEIESYSVYKRGVAGDFGIWIKGRKQPYIFSREIGNNVLSGYEKRMNRPLPEKKLR